MLIVIGVALVAIVVTALILLYNAQYSPDSFLGGSAQAVTNTVPTTTAVQFTEIARGVQSMEVRRVNYLITSTDELARLWEMIDAGGTPPPVDFATHRVMALFAGGEPTTGHSIEAAKVEDGTARKVFITLTKPGSGCIVAQSVTTPYQIIEVPTTVLSAEHWDTVQQTDCL